MSRTKKWIKKKVISKIGGRKGGSVWKILIIFAALGGGCNRQCQFGQPQEFKAKVVDIVPYKKADSTYYHVMLKFDIEVPQNPMCLEDIIKTPVDSAYLNRFKIALWSIYTGTYTPLESGPGGCPPYIIAFDQRLTP